MKLFVHFVKHLIKKSYRIRPIHKAVITAIVVIMIAFSLSAYAASDSFSLLDASERGMITSELAKGIMTPAFDESLKQDVLEIRYSLASGTSIEVWTKGFPAELVQEAANTAKIGVRVPNISQVDEIEVTLVIRGSEGQQNIPVALKNGWSFQQEEIKWDELGAIESAAYIISHKGQSKDAKGTIVLSLSFTNWTAPVLSNVLKKVKEVVTPQEIPSSLSLLDAGSRGLNKSETAKGMMVPTFDAAVEKDVLEVNYSVAHGAALEIWVKDFPEGLGTDNINTVRIGVRVLKADQANDIGLNVEIRGSDGTQTVPLNIKRGWNSFQAQIDWDTIGKIKELVFILSAIGDAERAKGMISIAADFVQGMMSDAAVAADSHFTPAFGLLDVGTKGTFNIGESNGHVNVEYNDLAKKEVFNFEYNAPKGTYVGVWTQEFPEEMGPDTVDAVNIGVYVPSATQLKEVAVKLEVKGQHNIQTIPIELRQGWNYMKEMVNWNVVGSLREVVFVVSSMGDATEEDAPAIGDLCFDLDFGKLSFIQKQFTYVKLGLIFLLSLIMAWLVSVVFYTKKDNKLNLNDDNAGYAERSFVDRVKNDLYFGAVLVLTAATGIFIHYLGTRTFLEAGCDLSFLTVAVAGVVIAQLLKIKLTGKNLTPREVFQNAFIAGFIAAASSKQGLLVAPATWAQIFTVSNLTAMIAFFIYVLANGLALSGGKKHLKGVTGALLVGMPFMFGWLLIVENENLIQLLSNSFTFGVLSGLPIVLGIVGRFLVILGFNELITNGVNLWINSRVVKDRRVHVALALISFACAIAPVIADLGSTEAVGSMQVVVRALIVIITTAVSFAGLWGEVYLLTGIALDCGKRTAPSWSTITTHVVPGVKKGMAYSAILVTLLFSIYMALNAEMIQNIMKAMPLVVGVGAGALFFPLVKTIIETFDGSLPFIDRMKFSYGHGTLYVRGAVVGFGFAYMVSQGMFQQEMSDRILFGLIIGLIASAGVSLIRDISYALRGCGRIQSWKLYVTDACLGVFVGSAAAFYLDARQVPVIIEKFKLYTSAGFSAIEYVTYPLVNKWGRIDLGTYSGGAKLLFTESLAGVINWSIAAWLFAVNKVFMQAFFDKEKAPIKFFFSKEGFAVLVEHMIYVLRWGLWMSPIIFTFLRMMPDPTWYNQDGAIRTVFAIFNNATMSPDQFQQWSLQMFVYVLAFDFFRVLIWMDHMGLRVATLVNLSFLGLDKLDEKVSKFIGPSTAQRCIPEGIKRFATWAPLLIPFYLPRGADWDYAWNTSGVMQNAQGPGIIASIQNMDASGKLMLMLLSIIGFTAVSYLVRLLQQRSRKRKVLASELSNRRYKVVLKENGEIYSEVDHQKRDVYPPEYDVTRRSYDPMHPCGRVLYVVDGEKSGKGTSSAWPIVGNFPTDRFAASHFEKIDDTLEVVNVSNGIRTTVDIELLDMDTTAEIWTINVENMTTTARELKIVPYCEWVLNGGLHDRFHTQYARLFPEMEYACESNAIFAWQKGTSSMGILAAEEAPEGFVTSRVDFIGRARSLWKPRVFETMDFMDIRNTQPYPTFDPIGSLLLNASVGPRETKTIRLMVGYATNRDNAVTLVNSFLKPKAGIPVPDAKAKKRNFLIGHGEIPPGTPQPYSEYAENGNKLVVKTPYTTRPYDHAMSNPMHSLMVTNRGLHTSCNGNSQQNRLTPDWPDMVGQEVPSEAIYLYDPDNKEWFAPTYFPLMDASVKHDVEFGVDGTAVFRMTHKDISTELTTFVPPEEPLGVYLLKVKNNTKEKRRMRVAPYFHMALAFQPEKSGALQKKYDDQLDALFFQNPRNMFRVGWAFASMSLKSDAHETNRGKFYGQGRGVDRPFMVENGIADADYLKDEGQIAGFIGTLELSAGEEATVAIVLGQTDTRKEAVELVKKYNNTDAATASLNETRAWWLGLMETVQYETNDKEFDRLQNWLKYQAIAERIWARRGLYQTSGAFGFRDQLQDTVNLLWVDPALARKQILLHASHQFIQGDVFHWFFTLTDGRTAFACRSHASDNLLWLCWATVEYLKNTGDATILDERRSYVVSEFPFAKLPKMKHGYGHLYHRSTMADSLYKHCLRSIDLVFNKRTGKNGLPLIQTGDWNDGLDEIGSAGKGESVWLGFFLLYILKNFLHVIEEKDGKARRDYYEKKMHELEKSLEATWRNDRYLRAFHDDGTEIGVEGSGIWETDALTAAWAVYSGINPEREEIVFNTAIRVLERDNAILLGYPALREDSKPYLGRSCKYPEGVRENGMYCHGVQWMIKASRILAERFDKEGDKSKAAKYKEIGYRLWRKITPITHVKPGEIEIYGGQPNKQAADILTNYDVGRMIWNGYTGAAGWLFRQAIEGVIGGRLENNQAIIPDDIDKPRGSLKVKSLTRDITKSKFKSHT